MSSSSSTASARLPVAGALVAGVVAAAGTALLSSYLPFALIVAAALGVVAVVFVVVDPFKAMLAMLLLRASVEGVRTVVLVRVLNVDVAPPDVLNLIFLGGAILWCARRLSGTTRISDVPLLVPALIFFAFAVVSLSYAPSPGPGLRDLVKFAAVFAAFVTIVLLKPDERQRDHLFNAVLLSAVVPLLVAGWQFVNSVGHANELHGGLRIQGTFEHPNTFGFYLVTVLTAAWVVMRSGPLLPRAVVLVIVAGSAVTLLLTLSRSSWVGAILVAVVIAWKDKRVLVGLTVVGVAFLAFIPRLALRVTDTFSPAVAGGGSSLFSRLEIWNRAFDLWLQRPLLGHGWAAFQVLTDKAAHNDFLRTLVELGIVGGGAFVAIMLGVVIRSLRAARLGGDLQLAMLGLAVAFVAMSAVTNNLGKMPFQWYFWSFAGVGLSVAAAAPSREPVRT